MNQNRWATPVIILVILIVSGFITVITPNIIRSFSGESSSSSSSVAIPSEGADAEEVTIDVERYLLGDVLVQNEFLRSFNSQDAEVRTYSSFTILGILTAIVIGGLAAFTVPIYLFVWLGDRFATAQSNDDGFKNQQAALAQKVKEKDKEENKVKPKSEVPTHDRPHIQAWVAGVSTVSLTYLLGYVLGEGISEGTGGTWANALALVSIPLSWFFFRPRVIAEINSGDYKEINYGLIWVILSGALLMGIGLGLVFIVVGGNNPLPFVEWFNQ
ncbi:MAG: hypothetical protein AAF633_25835 [Chloroflexota bacterium]